MRPPNESYCKDCKIAIDSDAEYCEVCYNKRYRYFILEQKKHRIYVHLPDCDFSIIWKEHEHFNTGGMTYFDCEVRFHRDAFKGIGKGAVTKLFKALGEGLANFPREHGWKYPEMSDVVCILSAAGFLQRTETPFEEEMREKDSEKLFEKLYKELKKSGVSPVDMARKLLEKAKEVKEDEQS